MNFNSCSKVIQMYAEFKIIIQDYEITVKFEADLMTKLPYKCDICNTGFYGQELLEHVSSSHR